MKFLYVMNGWKDAPHCWPIYLGRPFSFDITPEWFSVSFFGITAFFAR